jgi:glycine betaine/proline transport system permease protein
MLLFLPVLAGLLWFYRHNPGHARFPAHWNLGLRDPINAFQVWAIRNRTISPVFTRFFDPLSSSIDAVLRLFEGWLTALPWPVLLAVVWLMALRTGGWRAALAASAALMGVGLTGLWLPGLQTLTLIVVSMVIALGIGVPLGIWSARSERVERLLRPVLDAMQTLPAFVYLIPVLLFFGVARVPAVIATVIYALPPAIRLTSLGIRTVSADVLEAAHAFGATDRQILWRVQLPLALPTIMAAVNQTIMMALGIVVIAALIGAGGLGQIVFVSLRRLQVGNAATAGLAIVFLAIMLDRLTQLQTGPRRATGEREQLPFMQRYSTALTALAGVLVCGWLGVRYGWHSFPAGWQVDLATPVDRAVAWMRDNLYEVGARGWGTGALSDALTLHVLNPLRHLLVARTPWLVLVLLVALIGLLVSGWRLALGVALGTLGLGLLGMWELAMDTLSQVLVAVVIALALGLPLGVVAGISDRAERGFRPILDFLQTIPAFVYLVPVIMLFNIGRIPGIIASVLYALPPVIRLTSLGIRQVDASVTEAARAFGSTRSQTLRKVEIPLALPSVMQGINQTVMMVLAMVVIAGLVGGGGLGLEVVIGLTRSEMGRGLEAGLAIVLMAIVLDRLMQAAGTRHARRGVSSDG